MTEELKTKIQKLIEEKHFEEAIKLCDEAIEKDDKDEDAYFFKGNCYFDLKNYNKGIENLTKTIELNPNYEKAYFNRGLSKSYLKMYKENQLIYNKEKSKYASNIIDLNDLNNPNYKAELKEDDKKEDMIKYAFTKIFDYT
ncbi:tetratricopeptide repeat protein, partial [Brachyspira sp.]|uniref:tetratricopeptide repeat protein n=1 Tax=Brachyspira sp. TaxID=1977261 RepID=UPI00261A8C64